MKTVIKRLSITTILAALTVFVGCERRHDDHADHEHTAQHVAEAGTEQTMCPVMDAPINKDYSVEYEGRTVYFCCPGCDTTFLEEPEKYLHKLPQFQE